MLDKLKGAYKSLTIWFNTSGLILLSVALADPTLRQFLTDNNMMMYFAIGNIILRFKTNSNLADK